ncbi:MAG: helical backbone metal receptor [Flavobacteriales bacterium]|nr:helical backbone metal receptor [Flavobacteriales bacterium]
MAQRIISLVPSLTELLFDLGLANQIVGRTKFCIHPAELIPSVPIIGGTKTVKIDKIRELEPDIIIANKEENEQSQIELLSSQFNVLLTEIETLRDALNAINNIGIATNRNVESEDIIKKLSGIHQTLAIPIEQKPTILYFIWHAPAMIAGNNTYINDFCDNLGLNNLGVLFPGRYPKIEPHDFQNVPDPEFVLLSSEPFPFKEKHLKHYMQLFPNSRILLVDGEVFSWYGTRLLKRIDYLKTLKEQYFR